MLGWRTLAATLLVFAAWRWREEPEGLLPGTAAAALAPLPRGARSPEEFFRDHVQKGVPLLLPLEGNFDALDQLLTGPCADEPLDLLSTQQADVLRDLLDEDLPRWKWFVANLILVLTTGTTVQGWAALRRATPLQLSQGPAAASSYGAPWAAWLMDLVAKAFGSELLRHVAVIAKLIAQPVYLADKVVKEICPSLMDHAALTEHEEYVLRRLGNRQAPWQNLSVIADIGLRHESETRLFYGGPKSYSYPLHRDLPDGDVLCVLHSGCKDVVMLKPESRKHLARLKVPGFEGYLG
ncbi:unnamed protein product [Effrenium voratum]|nr:unnamed protein product [Effrenium voratum]